MPDEKNTALWYVLNKIQNDIDKIDEKWDKIGEKWDNHIFNTANLTHELTAVTARVHELNKLLTIDNGKPSVISQLKSISTDMTTLKNDVIEIKQDLEAVKVHVGIKTPKEVRLEKVKNWGKAIGVLGLALPGILSFLTGLLSH